MSRLRSHAGTIGQPGRSGLSQVVRRTYMLCGNHGERTVYKVTGIDPSGRAMTFACGTDEQALERTWELARRGFKGIMVADPSGREQSAAAFERSLDLAYD